MPEERIAAKAAKRPMRRSVCDVAASLNRGSLVVAPLAILGHGLPMPYRRTENVARRLAARHAAIIAAARERRAKAAWRRCRSRRWRERAGIAAGTVYRYFPGKTDLVAALLAEIAEREIGALRRAADAAPGPLSALAAAVMTFAVRALRDRRLDLRGDRRAGRCRARRRAAGLSQSAGGEFAARIAAAAAGRHLPEQDAALAAAALVGLLIEG